MRGTLVVNADAGERCTFAVAEHSQTHGGITRIAFPVIFGAALDSILGPPSPFIISATMVLMTLTLGRDMELYAPRAKPA